MRTLGLSARLGVICTCLLSGISVPSTAATVAPLSVPVPCSVIKPAEPGIHGAYVAPGLWPGGTIPYTFDANVSAANQAYATNVMADIERYCGVSFVPRSGQTAYMAFIDWPGNAALVGRGGGKQETRIHNWDHPYIVAHEILHVMGVYHEQSRLDRDLYVTISNANITAGQASNFDKETFATGVGAYDFISVMHYAACAYSSCSSCDPTNTACTTIQPLPEYAETASRMGQRRAFSRGDAATLKAMYPGGQPLASNDLCETATELDYGQTVTGSTLVATFDGVPQCGVSITAAGVWYSLIGDGGRITASTCGSVSDFDTKLNVFSNACTNLTCVTGNDDSCSGDPASKLSTASWQSVYGAPYWILVQGGNSEKGTFTLSISSEDGSPLYPEIGLLGTNGLGIADGDATPDTGDGTDFGAANIGVESVTATFVVTNSGLSGLVLSGVTVSGAAASDFEVIFSPTTLARGHATNLTIHFTPSAEGVRDATVNVASDDPNEHPYDFAVRGYGTAAPEIALLGINGAEIADGDFSPSLADGTDFGPLDVNSAPFTQVFTITNSGTGTSIVRGVVIRFGGPAFSPQYFDWHVIPPGGSTNLYITFTPPLALGQHVASFTFASDDEDEEYYDFYVQGTVTSAVFFTVSPVTNMGTFQDTGATFSTSTSMFTGELHDDVKRNGYCIFDLSGVTGTVGAATLHMELDDYYGTDPTESFTVFGVTSTAAAVASDYTAGDTEGQRIYQDLGAGSAYASRTVNPAEVDTVLEIDLSDHAIRDINAAIGGSFIVGLRLTSLQQGGASAEGVHFARKNWTTQRLVLYEGEVPPVPPAPIVDLSPDLTFRILNAASGGVAPYYATNLATLPVSWQLVPSYSSTLSDGTNIIEMDMPLTNAHSIFFRIQQSP